MIAKRPPFGLFLAAVLAGVTCAPQGELPHKKVEALPAVVDRGAPPLVQFPGAPTGLKDRIDAALDNVRRRDLLTTHAFWTVFHGILGLGPDVTLFDPDTGKRVKALDFICNGGMVRGLEFSPQPDGVDVVTWPGSGVGQGHQDQFIAEMSQW